MISVSEWNSVKPELPDTPCTWVRSHLIVDGHTTGRAATQVHGLSSIKVLIGTPDEVDKTLLGVTVGEGAAATLISPPAEHRPGK